MEREIIKRDLKEREREGFGLKRREMAVGLQDGGGRKNSLEKKRRERKRKEKEKSSKIII